MKVELVIQKNKELPTGVVVAIEPEFQQGLLKLFPDCRTDLRLDTQKHLWGLKALKGAKELVENNFRIHEKVLITGFIDGNLYRQITQQRRLR